MKGALTNSLLALLLVATLVLHSTIGRDVATMTRSLNGDTVFVSSDSSAAAAVGNCNHNSSSSSSFSSVFTQARNVVFQNVAREEQERIRTRVVKPFNLTTWTKRTKGGLEDADRTLLAQIYGKANSVFEFGLGESTYIANYVDVPRYSGVDSDADWVKMCRDSVAGHFRFYTADIGRTVAWGFPADRSQVKNVANYQVAPLEAEPRPFDVYMVDGRWRFALLMLSFLHAAERGADRAHTTVLLHDCWQPGGISDTPKHAKRDVYRSADHLLDLVTHSGKRLCVYKRKPSTTDEQLLALWKTHYTNVE